MLGLKPNPITNKEGDLKATGFRGVLTEAEHEFVQKLADQMFGEFKAHVTAYRQIPDDAMRGQWLTGSDMLAANLADQIGEEPEALALLRTKLG
jgi:ClpP class serine protease